MKASDGLNNETLEAFDNTKNEIFEKLNCAAVGKIEKVNYVEQTVEASVVYKHLSADGKVGDYPLLLDVPFFVLQGSGSFIEMPVSKGDYCILLFCDRNYSTWWDSANEKEPESGRKHSLSDGIAIVGINPKPKTLGLNGEALRVKTDKPLKFEGSEICLNGNDRQFVTWSELNQALQTYHNAVFAAVTAAAGNTPPTPATLPAPDISAAKTTTVKTGG